MRRLSPGRLCAVATVFAACASCSDSASLALTTGELSFSIAASSVALPTELRDGDRVASLPCPTGTCPAVDTGVTLACVSGTCDPAVHTITLPIDEVLDFDDLGSDLMTLFRSVDAIELTSLQYVVRLNTLSVDVDEIEIFWGPEGAVDVDPAMDVVKLATLPAQRARETGMGEARIDAAGRDALSDYLVGSSRRIRLFLRTRVDLEPGDPFPEGEANVVAVMRVEASGSYLE